MRLLGLLLVVALTTQNWEAAPLSPTLVPSATQCLRSSCFALFWVERSFLEASDLCKESGGRLLRMGSRTTAGAVALLLRGRTAYAWLGLHRPQGPCQTKRLRGFQWMSGDKHTDDIAWARTRVDSRERAPICGPRCVVVTQELSWQERACNAPADGFLCEYSHPVGTCAPLNPPPPAKVFYLTPFGARGTDLVALPPGTTAVVPSLSATLTCRTHRHSSWGWWETAVVVTWACRLENRGCEGQCHWDKEGQPHCTCPGGPNLSEKDRRSCSSPCAQLGCQHYCMAQRDSAVCMCWEGYMLDADGRSCVNLDVCHAEPSPCEQECVSTPGGFECKCFAGFVFMGGKCKEDMQPCFDLLCQHECTLVNGAYKCTCFEGYVPDPLRPNQCVGFCNQTQCPADCDPLDEECFCPDGFVLEENETKVCTDIDECESGYCEDLECINNPGSYNCICPSGLLVKEQKFCEKQKDRTS